MKIVRILLSLFVGIIPIVSLAQIGYQVSLLNSATGEPRAGETVEVEITLTDDEDNIIYKETQTSTSNDFGILSIAIGNENTFANVDWGKLPFFVSATVDGKMIGKSQVLTVPVAEYAKRTGTLTKEKLVGTWECSYNYERIYIYSDGKKDEERDSRCYRLKFFSDGTGIYEEYEYGDFEKPYTYEFNYVIEDNLVMAFYNYLYSRGTYTYAYTVSNIKGKRLLSFHYSSALNGLIPNADENLFFEKISE